MRRRRNPRIDWLPLAALGVLGYLLWQGQQRVGVFPSELLPGRRLDTGNLPTGPGTSPRTTPAGPRTCPAGFVLSHDGVTCVRPV